MIPAFMLGNWQKFSSYLDPTFNYMMDPDYPVSFDSILHDKNAQTETLTLAHDSRLARVENIRLLSKKSDGS